MATISGRVVKRKRQMKNYLFHEPNRSFMKPEDRETPLNHCKGPSIASSDTQRKWPDRKLQQLPRPAVWPDQFVSSESAHAVQVATDEQVEPSILCLKCSKISAWLQKNQPPTQYPYALRSLTRPRYGYTTYGLPQPIASFHHYNSGMALEQSYLEGCHLCTLIWHCFLQTDIIGPEEAIKDYREKSLAFLRKITKLKHSLHWYKFSEHDIGLILSTTWSLSKDVKPPASFIDLAGPPFARHIRLEPCSSLWSLPRFSAKTTSSRQFHTLHPISTSSQQLLDLAAAWVHECKSSHESCQETTINTRKLPTRLVYLDPTGEHCTPRLVTTAHTVICSQYLTLSYCWGGCNTTILTKENLTSFHQEIWLDSLPKTIRDAICVSKQLGFDFLWVDSLCIVQDDPDDWAREAASMADVYSNCFLTIAALDGSSSNSGLFCQRDPLVYSKCKMFQDRSGIDVYTQLSGDPRGPSPLESYFKQAPLHKRGWVTQERLLSPRTLNFGVTLIWECQHLFQDEFLSSRREPQSTFKPSFSKLQIRDRVFNIEKPLADQEMYSFWKFWTKLVEFFTAASLTVKSDRTVALSGAIASIARNTGWRSTAGLWEPFLLQELLWAIWPPISSDSEPRSPAVPTWSWFSTDSKVRFWYRRHAQYLSTAKIVVQSPVSSRLEKSKRETIHLTCNLMRFSKLPSPTFDETHNADVRVFVDIYEMRHLWPHGLIDSKTATRRRAYAKSLFFAPISEEKISFHGLALRKSVQWPGTYERVGMVTVQQLRYDSESNTWKEHLSLRMKSLMEKAQRKTIVLV